MVLSSAWQPIQRIQKIIQLLLKYHADPNTELTRCEIAPLYLAIQRNNPEIVELLLQYGANPNPKPNRRKDTLLHLAMGMACKEDKEGKGMKIMQLLLQYGADPDKPGQWGYTPIDLAARMGYTEMTSLLLKADAELTDQEIVTNLTQLANRQLLENPVRALLSTLFRKSVLVTGRVPLDENDWDHISDSDVKKQLQVINQNRQALVQGFFQEMCSQLPSFESTPANQAHVLRGISSLAISYEKSINLSSFLSTLQLTRGKKLPAEICLLIIEKMMPQEREEQLFQFHSPESDWAYYLLKNCNRRESSLYQLIRSPIIPDEPTFTAASRLS